MIFLLLILILDGLSDGSGTKLKKCDCHCDHKENAVKIAVSLRIFRMGLVFWMQILELF